MCIIIQICDCTVVLFNFSTIYIKNNFRKNTICKAAILKIVRYMYNCKLFNIKMKIHKIFQHSHVMDIFAMVKSIFGNYKHGDSMDTSTSISCLFCLLKSWREDNSNNNVLCTCTCMWSLSTCTTLVRPKNKNVHRFTHNLHGIKITMVESYPWNISAWCVIVFE